MNIFAKPLRMIPYSGAGNNTPVLDISEVFSQTDYSPQEVRTILEHDEAFRQFLQREGKKLAADSVMIFYQSNCSGYDYITFVGEPNAPLTNHFSDMCGNGIRCLALHIVLSEKNKKLRSQYVFEVLRIWAGSVRTIQFSHIDFINQEGLVSVDMGRFCSKKEELGEYINPLLFSELDLCATRVEQVSRYLSNKLWGIGYNGNRTGEPHLCLLFTQGEYHELLKNLGIYLQPHRSYIPSLRYIVSVLGHELTFNTRLFPQGINVNIGVIRENTIYVATHERNLTLSQELCKKELLSKQYCRCNTLACGTGGAAMSNIAYKQGYLTEPNVLTVHPGGKIYYDLTEQTTIMTGPAMQLEFSSLMEGKQL